ncbi:serine hydrolase [Streptomyces sp. NPDC048106]|uniref:serine hydrolase n=1 Tax=Streptomyces sp. NPDC048106 TaxID=3155750 RepID=UPI003454A046
MPENPPRHRRRSRREQRRRRKARRRRLIWAVTTAVVLCGAATVYAVGRPHSGKPSVQAAAEPKAPRATSASVPPVPEPMDLESALAPVTDLFGDNEMSVAVQDTASGKWAVFGDGAFDTASIVKVDILATLLLQAQDAGRVLTAQERVYATKMIENSDNDSTSALWTEIGSAEGLDAANRRLGLTQTRGGDGTVWGVTQTTAQDQVRLLQKVFGDTSPLSSASRAYIRNLMSHIATDQDWGVSAAADGGSPTALKNGWLQRSQTHAWDVNSIGRIERDGRVYLLAVLLNGCSTEEVGIKLVEQAAVAAVTAFADTLTGSAS